MIAWLRYRISCAAALPIPAEWNSSRYPKTLQGGWRYFREQAAPAEVAYWLNNPRYPSAWWPLLGLPMTFFAWALPTDLAVLMAAVGAVLVVAPVAGAVERLARWRRRGWRQAPTEQTGGRS